MLRRTRSAPYRIGTLGGGSRDRRERLRRPGAEEKVKFSEAEIASTLAKLDDAIARMAALRTEVEDPEGLIRFTLGDDGRLLTLFIQDNVGQLLTTSTSRSG